MDGRFDSNLTPTNLDSVSIHYLRIRFLCKISHFKFSISMTLCFSIAIRYFAGGSPFDLMSSHGVGYSDVYRSIWIIVDMINIKSLYI